MKYLILTFSFLLLGISATQAQWCYDKLSEKENVTVKYKWKENSEGEKELRIKFNNQAGSDLNVNLELGFYHNGILEEKAVIADCLKRYFWNDWFRPIHIVANEELTQEELESDQFSLEITDLKTEKVEKCEETHD